MRYFAVLSLLAVTILAQGKAHPGLKEDALAGDSSPPQPMTTVSVDVGGGNGSNIAAGTGASPASGDSDSSARTREHKQWSDRTRQRKRCNSRPRYNQQWQALQLPVPVWTGQLPSRRLCWCWIFWRPSRYVDYAFFCDDIRA